MVNKVYLTNKAAILSLITMCVVNSVTSFAKDYNWEVSFAAEVEERFAGENNAYFGGVRYYPDSIHFDADLPKL